MKKNIKIRLAVWAMLFVGMVLSAGCSKDIPLVDKPVVEEEQPTKNYPEYRLYTVGDSALFVTPRLFNPITEDWPGGDLSQVLCHVDFDLETIDWVSETVQYTFGDRTIVTTPLTSTRIVGMDVITNADYDDAHPAGSSVADIMELNYYGEKYPYHSTDDLNNYFATHEGLDIIDRPNRFMFWLSAKTPPLEGNEVIRTDLAFLEPGESIGTVDFTVIITFEDGSVIEMTDLMPLVWIM